MSSLDYLTKKSNEIVPLLLFCIKTIFLHPVLCCPRTLQFALPCLNLLFKKYWILLAILNCNLGHKRYTNAPTKCSSEHYSYCVLGAVLHVEAVLGGVLALRDDQPRGGVLHPRRRHLREAGGAARERGQTHTYICLLHSLMFVHHWYNVRRCQIWSLLSEALALTIRVSVKVVK